MDGMKVDRQTPVWVYASQGHGGPGANPGNAGHDAGTYPGWDAMHTFIHTFIHTQGKFRVANPPTQKVTGRWEDTQLRATHIHTHTKRTSSLILFYCQMFPEYKVNKKQ